MAQLDTDRTHRLGFRAFLLFLGWSALLVVLLAAGTAAWWWYGARLVPARYVTYYDYSVKLLALVVAVFALYRLVGSYLAYRSHAYRFDDEFFHVTRGYVSQQEVGVVYHQIQTVTVQRPLGARLVGVAHLAIVTNSGSGATYAAHLFGLDRAKARLVQRELLARAKASQQASREPRYRPVPFVEDEEDEG